MSTNKIFAEKALGYEGQGPSKFRKWYYGTENYGTPWCAVFVSYVANQVGILNKTVKRCEGAGDFARQGTKAGWGKWYEGHNTKPQVGDIITFVWNGKGKYENRDIYYSDHVGIVYKVDSNRVYTIEGNTNGTNDSSIVSKRVYALYSGVINGYYRPNWTNTTNEPKKETSSVINKVTSITKPNVYYQAKTTKHGWLPAVKNLNDYAGIEGTPITDIAIKADKGSIKYRVHVKGGNWLPYVTGYNIKDHNNGYAGNGKPIDAIEVYYFTPDDYARKHGYLCAKYRVSPTNASNYFAWQTDNNKGNGMDGYAGAFGKAIDKIQIYLV